MNNDKTPLVRFKGYTDTWKQRKLKELAERVTRKNQDLLSTLPLTISAQYGLIDQNKFFDKRIASKDISGYYLIYNGEFAYNKSTSSDAPWGAIKRLDRYESGVLSTLYIVFRIREEKETSSNFLATYYDSNSWHKEVQAIAAEGARNHGLLNIAPNDFFENEIMIPQEIDEQKKIGDYFIRLDNIITLHQHKYDKLLNIKKSLLDKMFPKDGSLYPEIRFNQFTEAWGQRKIREIADRFDNLRIPVSANLRISGTTPYYGANGIQDYVHGYTHDGEFVLVAEDGANNLKNYPVKCVNGRIWVNNHAHVLQGKENRCDNQFLSYSINQTDIESLLVGGGRAKLNAEIMMSIELMCPYMDEQQQIGSLFIQLDNLITLHQRKLEKLKNLKQSMLEKMFI